MALQVAQLGKDAVIRISNDQGEELEITGVDVSKLSLYIDAAKVYLSQQVVQSTLVQSILYVNGPHSLMSWSLDRLSVPSPSGHASPAYHTPARDSFTSITTDTPSLPDGFRHKSRENGRPIPTSWPRTHPSKRYLCPTCGTQLTQASDYKRHIHRKCEMQPRRYQCGDCDCISEEEATIELHWTTTLHSGLLVLPSIDKKAFGCPFCARCLHSLEDYFQCMRKHQESNDPLHTRPIPNPSSRLRALLGQSDTTTRSIRVACTNQGLCPTDWEHMAWTDADCDRFSNRLEYGYNASDDIYGWGVQNLDEFMEEVVSCAKFEDTGRPVPPLKESTPGPSSSGAMYGGFMPTPCDSRVGDYQFDFGEFSGGPGMEQSGLSFGF